MLTEEACMRGEEIPGTSSPGRIHTYNSQARRGSRVSKSLENRKASREQRARASDSKFLLKPCTDSKNANSPFLLPRDLSWLISYNSIAPVQTKISQGHDSEMHIAR